MNYGSISGGKSIEKRRKMRMSVDERREGYGLELNRGALLSGKGKPAARPKGGRPRKWGKKMKNFSQQKPKRKM